MFELLFLSSAVALAFLAFKAGQKAAPVSAATSITQTVNETASERVKAVMLSVFEHYQDTIVNGTILEAETALNILNVKIGHLKTVQGKVKVLDSVLQNVETYE